ncbi:MAG TPA: hypothetical protein PKH24_17370 [Sedimentisphaerales bacterium]|jgi:hypothetical protein|nr:hypothetical protein [Sedimentisphaerales bacterium]HNU30695.1 hypothetical protein [Sedimentisphaerales bacterium]
MAIDRSSIRVLAARVGAVAILMAGHFCVVRGQAAAPDSSSPQTLSDQGSIIGWGTQRINSRLFSGRYTAIAAGGSHSLALKKDGSIVGWGSNYLFRGPRSGTVRTGQAMPPDGNDFTAIAAGYNHSLAIRREEPSPVP